MKKVFLSLGSNMGNKKNNLARAIRYINVGMGHIIDLSGIYETEPWGFGAQESFLNLVVEIITDLSPVELLGKCQEIEDKLGRTRNKSSERYSSRIIDIDILLYDKEVVSESELIIPHPLLHERNFVLEPLSEIAADYVHPVLGYSIKTIFSNCTDKSKVTQLGSIMFD